MRDQPATTSQPDGRTMKAMLRVIYYATQMAQYYEDNDDHWTICHNLALHYLNDIDLDILKPAGGNE